MGPGGEVTLAAGIWRIWVRVTDNPEVPVLRAGSPDSQMSDMAYSGLRSGQETIAELKGQAA